MSSLSRLLHPLEDGDTIQVINNKNFYYGSFFIVRSLERDAVWVYEIASDKRLLFKRLDVAYIGKAGIQKKNIGDN